MGDDDGKQGRHISESLVDSMRPAAADIAPAASTEFNRVALIVRGGRSDPLWVA